MNIQNLHVINDLGKNEASSPLVITNPSSQDNNKPIITVKPVITVKPDNISIANGKKKWTSKNKLLFGIGIWNGSKKKKKKQKATKNKSKKLLICNLCEKTFSSVQCLEKHLQIHAGEKLFKCSFCQKGFNTKYGLDRHLFTHNGISNSICKFCEKRFATNQALIIHTRSHTIEKPFSCDKCSKNFSSQASLTRHTLCHAEKTSLCNECGNVYASNQTLQIHMQSHTKERNFPCSKCRMRFKRKIDLNRHEQKHEDIQRLPCPLPQCEHQFRRKDNLIRHLKLTHNQTKEEANESFNLVNASWKGSEYNDSEKDNQKDSNYDDLDVYDQSQTRDETPSVCLESKSDITNVSNQSAYGFEVNVRNEEAKFCYEVNRVDPINISGNEIDIMRSYIEAENIPNSAIHSSVSSATTSVIRLSSSESRNFHQKHAGHLMEICHSPTYLYTHTTVEPVVPSSYDYNVSIDNDLYTQKNDGEMFRARIHPVSDSGHLLHSDERLDTLSPHRSYLMSEESEIHRSCISSTQYVSFQNLQPVQDFNESDATGFLDLSCHRKHYSNEDSDSINSEANYYSSLQSSSWNSPHIISRTQIINRRPENVTVIRRASPIPNYSNSENISTTAVSTNTTSTRIYINETNLEAPSGEQQNCSQVIITSPALNNSQLENAVKTQNPEREGTTLPYFNRDPRKNFLWTLGKL